MYIGANLNLLGFFRLGEFSESTRTLKVFRTSKYFLVLPCPSLSFCVRNLQTIQALNQKSNPKQLEQKTVRRIILLFFPDNSAMRKYKAKQQLFLN